MLAEKLVAGEVGLSDGWNFGPNPDAVRPVSELAAGLCAHWGDDARWHAAETTQPHEARMLALDSSKARAEIGWRPRLTLDEALEWTARWYKDCRGGADMRARTLEQIRQYQEIAP
jgi:CDP-glucose 4,6-dehydratase